MYKHNNMLLGKQILTVLVEFVLMKILLLEKLNKC